MGKFCLAAVSLSYLGRLSGCLVLLLGLAGLPAFAASRQASAVLHIQITVVPTVQAPNAQLTPTSPSGPVTYNLQPTTTPKMTSQVTVQPVSTSDPANRVKSGANSGKGAVLQTTTLIVE